MKKVKAWLSIGYAGASREEIFEFDDDASEEEMEADIKDWAFNYIEWGFSPLADGEDEE